jgi:CHAT domain-containing protein
MIHGIAPAQKLRQPGIMGGLKRLLVTWMLAAISITAALAQDVDRSALVPEYGTNSKALTAAYAARDSAKAVAIAARQAEILCALDGAQSHNCATGHRNHGVALIAAGRYDAALAPLSMAHATLVALPDATADQRHNVAYMIDRLEALPPLLASPEGRKSTALVELFRSLSEKFNAGDELPLKLDMFNRALAIQLAARGENDDDSIAMMRGSSTLLFLSGRQREARDMLARAAIAAERFYGVSHPQTGTVLLNLGQSEVHYGNNDGGITALRRAVAIFDVAGVVYPGDRENAVRSLTWVLEASGRTDEAEPLLRRLVELMPTGVDQAYARLDLAENLLERRQLAEAQRLLDALSAEHFNPVDPSPPMLAGLIERQRARAAILAGNWGDVAMLMERSLPITGPGLPAAYRAEDVAIWADARARLGDRQEARRLFDDVLAWIADNGLETTREGIAAKLSAARFFLGEVGGIARARDLLTQANAAAERQRLDAPTNAAGQQGLFRREAGYRPLYLTMADAWYTPGPTHARDGDHGIGFQALQRAMLGTATRAVALSAARRAAGQNDAELGAVAGALQQTEEQLQFTERSLDAGLTDPKRVEERDALAAQITMLQDRRDLLAAQVQAQFPDYFNLIRPTSIGLPAFQAMLGETEAVLLAVPAPDGVHVMAITRDTAHWHKAMITQDRLDTDVRRLLWFAGASVSGTAIEELEWQDAVPGPNAFDRTTAHRLYQQIIAPVMPTLQGKTHLFVSAGGVLSRLPFSILVSAPPTDADDDAAALRDTRWLADDFALIHLPSLQSLYLQRSMPRAAIAAPLPFAGIGDPALDGPPSKRAKRGAPVVSVAALRQLEQLPGTATELRAVSARYGKDALLMLRADASEAAVMAAPLGRYRILTFATHALMAGEVGGAREAGLVLSPPDPSDTAHDGYLAMSEVAAMRLNADWVILSACNSAGDDGSIGATGLSGLARAFFFAGAQNLLASHWPVLDAAAPPLIIDTLDPAMANDRAAALQMAMRTMRQRPGFEDSGNSYSHPRVWAPFVLIGDWR